MVEYFSLSLASMGELGPTTMAWKPNWDHYTSFASFPLGDFCIVDMLVRNLIHIFPRLILQQLSDEDAQLRHVSTLLADDVVENKKACSVLVKPQLIWD